MTRAAALVALVAVFATGAGTAAAQQPHRTTTAAGRWLADRLEGRDLIRPDPTVPGIGTFTKTLGRFREPGSIRTFTKEPGDFEGPVRIVPVWRPREIRCVGNYRCQS